MPLTALELVMRKFYLFWSHIEISNNLSYYSFERSSAVLTALPVGFWLLGSLGLAGAIHAWRERRARLPLLFMWSYCAITVAFFVCDRFRLPIVPLLCVFSGYTLQFVTQLITARRWGPSILFGLLIAGSALLVNTNILQLRPEIRLGEEELQAGAAMESGDLAKAAELFGRVAALDQENPGARVNQGNALWRMGKTREAIEAFHAGIGSDPYFALLNLAHLYFTMRLPDSALFYADRSITARPFAPGGYIIAAQSMMVLHDMPQAEQVLLKGVIACGSEFIYGNFLLAGIYLENGNPVAADSIYRKVLVQAVELQQTEYVIQSEKSRFGEEIATVYAKTLHALGRMLTAQQKLDSSEVYLRAAAQQLPKRSDVWADLGICLIGMNRLEEADTVFRRAISIDTYNPLLWFNYAVVLARKGELQDARRAASQALALKPDFEEAGLLVKTLDTKASQHSFKK
jgi:tetratricopeptide (TPR) repeat protein